MAAVTARRLAWKRNEVDVLRVSRWNTRNAVELPTRPNTIRNPMSRDDITNEYSRHPGSSSDAGSAPAVVVSQSASPASLTSRRWAWRIVTSSVVIVSSFSFNLRSTVPTHAMLPWMGLLHSTARGYFAAYKRQATQGLFGKTEQRQGNERDKSATDCEIKTTDEIWRQSQAAAAFGPRVTHCNWTVDHCRPTGECCCTTNASGP